MSDAKENTSDDKRHDLSQGFDVASGSDVSVLSVALVEENGECRILASKVLDAPEREDSLGKVYLPWHLR